MLDKKKIGTKVSLVSIIINTLLSFAKFFLGIIGKSSALISDGIHSASDVISSIIVIIGLRMSTKAADKKHLYGHERIESVASIILSQLLTITAIFIAYKAIINIKTEQLLSPPAMITLIIAAISIIIKELMYHYTKYWAKKVDSSALMADAWHHRSDSLSSIASLVGIFFARMGYLKMDSIAAIVISIFILKVAYDIFKDSIDKLIDESCSIEETEKLTKTILAVDGVIDIDDLKSRKFGTRAYLDVEIRCDGNLSLKAAHAIAEKVQENIENKFPFVKHIMVHVNPNN